MKTKKAAKSTRRPKRNGSRKRRVRLNVVVAMKPKEEKPWYVGKPLVSQLVEDHSDDRGRFITIETATTFQHPIGSVAFITRKAGSVFAEHRHAREGHTCILTRGKAVYHERNAQGRMTPLQMMPFVPVFTPPDVDHAFEALEDLEMICIANISRTQAEYEADVVRLKGDERLVKVPAVPPTAEPT